MQSLPSNPFLSDSGSAEEKKEVSPSRSGASETSRALTDIQFSFREKAASYLQAIRTDPGLKLYLSLGAAAFLYGLFHGAGPGHRKTIIFTLFLGKKARFWEPLAAGFLSAGVHAGVSLVLILILNFVIREISLMNTTNTAGIWLEGGTYILLVVLSLVLFIIRIFRGEHSHHSGKTGRSIYPMIFVASLIPCPGAIMLLLFAVSLGLLGPGILGLVFMSAGMGVVISAAGYLAYAGREGLFSRLKNNEAVFARISTILEAGAYLFIALFSLYMAWPFVLSILEI